MAPDVRSKTDGLVESPSQTLVKLSSSKNGGGRPSSNANGGEHGQREAAAGDAAACLKLPGRLLRRMSPEQWRRFRPVSDESDTAPMTAIQTVGRGRVGKPEVASPQVRRGQDMMSTVGATAMSAISQAVWLPE